MKSRYPRRRPPGVFDLSTCLMSGTQVYWPTEDNDSVTCRAEYDERTARGQLLLT